MMVWKTVKPQYKMRGMQILPWKEIMKSIKQQIALLSSAAILLLSAASCSVEMPIVSEVGLEQAYSNEQTMIIIATERNRCRDVYTDQIWQVDVDGEGTTFQKYLLNEIQKFMRELKTLNLLADERDIRLTGQERERIRELAAQYYESLTTEDLGYIGASEEDVRFLYEQYCRANKLVDELTKDVNLEISDSEAKVIRVQEIAVDDAAFAESIRAQAAAEGSDFLSLARSVSKEEEVEKPIGRGEPAKEYEEAVFSLEEGQVSEVIPLDGLYYIVKVVDDYDEDATQERKAKLAMQRKNQAFRQIYDAFEQEHPINLRGDLWDTSTMDRGEGSTTTDFFTIYHEFMEE